MLTRTDLTSVAAARNSPREILDASGRVVEEIRLDASGQLLGSFEYD